VNKNSSTYDLCGVAGVVGYVSRNIRFQIKIPILLFLV